MLLTDTRNRVIRYELVKVRRVVAFLLLSLDRFSRISEYAIGRRGRR